MAAAAAAPGAGPASTSAPRTAIGSAAGLAAGGAVPGYAPPRPTRELTVRSADGIRLFAEVYGDEADPAVVLVHGWTCSTAFWAPVVRELTAHGLRVVAYDQRGHGRSGTGTPYAYSPAVLADDLCAVLDAALHPGERAVVGGHSMGAATLVAAAGRRQLTERGAALLLCGAGVRSLAARARVLPLRSPRIRIPAQRLVLRSRAPLPPAARLTRRALARGAMGPAAGREQIDLAARLVRACPRWVRAGWGAVLDELDLAAKVPHLTMPTAVVAGTADLLTPPVHAREIARALPDCRDLHEWRGIGHMTPLERPEAVADVLRGLARDHLPHPDTRNGGRTVPATAADGAAVPAQHPAEAAQDWADPAREPAQAAQHPAEVRAAGPTAETADGEETL